MTAPKRGRRAVVVSSGSAAGPGIVGAVAGAEHEVSLFLSGRTRHTMSKRDWSSDVCSSDLVALPQPGVDPGLVPGRTEERCCCVPHPRQVAAGHTVHPGQGLQPQGCSCRLLPAGRGQPRVRLPLVPALGVPDRLAVPDEVDGRGHAALSWFHGRTTGTAARSVFVYLCCGSANSCSVPACSTTWPRFMTITSSLMCRTTERSWAMNR